MLEAYNNDNNSIKVTMSASDLCDLLKAKFNSGYEFSGVTGDKITWDSNGYVNKSAIKYVIKEHD